MASKASYFQKYLARVAAAAGRSTAFVSKQINHAVSCLAAGQLPEPAFLLTPPSRDHNGGVKLLQEAGLEEWVGDVRRIGKLQRKALLAARWAGSFMAVEGSIRVCVQAGCKPTG